MFYDASGEQIDFPSYEPYHKTESNPDHQPQPQQNSKKYVRIIVVLIIILVLIVGIFLAIFFSLKRKEDGGTIFVTYAVKEYGKTYTLFNKNNINEDDYEINDTNNKNTRLLDVTINNKRRLDKNEKELSEPGTYIYSIKFNKVINSLEGMFENIQILKLVNFSKFESKKVVNMNRLFYNCTNLEEVNFTNFNTEKLISMDNSFEKCSNLKILDLSSFSTPKLNSMTSAFKNCSNLLSLNIKNFIFNSNFDLDNIFGGCERLVNIKVPDNNQKILDYQKNSDELSKCEENEISGCNLCGITDLINTNINISVCLNCRDSFVPISSPYQYLCDKCIDNCKNCTDEFTCDECYENYILSFGNFSCERIINPPTTNIENIN